MSERSSRNDRRPSANERFKRRWRSWVGSSTLVAVAIHAALFAVIAWEMVVVTPDPTRFQGRSLVLLPPADEESAPGGIPAQALPLVAEGQIDEAAEPNEPQAYDDAGADADLGELWDRLNRRLGERTALVPSLSEPDRDETEPVDDHNEASDVEDDPEIDGGRSALADLSILPESDSLDLSRLDEISPELALITPSSWVLIRNPLEVEAYLRGSYSGGRIDPAAEGSVSVTLWIDERGSVEWAEISESSGRPDLDEFALALFNEVAVFRPAREEGVRVSRSVSFALNFPF